MDCFINCLHERALEAMDSKHKPGPLGPHATNAHTDKPTDAETLDGATNSHIMLFVENY